jgi:hypothetical protein
LICAIGGATDLSKVMTPTSLIVVADRGSLKAYKVDGTPNRGPSLHLIQAFNITDAHGRLSEKVTDQAGRAPAGGGGGGDARHASSMAERTGLDSENDRRIHKQIVEHIVRIVKGDGMDGWSFAAPASIHSAVVDALPAEVRDRVVEYVKSDLVKIEPAKLGAHFRSLKSL